MSQSFNVCFRCGCNFDVSLIGLSDLCLDCINKKDIWMSEKSLEEKFKEWFENNCIADQYEDIRGLFNVVWLKDAHKAGYLIAQKEMQEKLDAAIREYKRIHDILRGEYLFYDDKSEDFLKARGE